MKPYPNSPFKLENTEEYQQWRENKLKQAKTNKNKCVIQLKSTPPHFFDVFKEEESSGSHDNTINRENTRNFIDQILKECSSDNYCLYAIKDHKEFDQDIYFSNFTQGTA